MFGWLAKLLVTSPVQGSSCACCEGNKKRLEKMQQALAEGIPSEETQEGKKEFSSGRFSAHINSDGSGEIEYFAAAPCDGKCSCGESCSCDDDVCHCGKGENCCKKTGKKDGCTCGCCHE